MTDAREAPLRVAFVIYGLAGGGAERAVSLLSAHLVNRGHDVSVVTMSPPRNDAYPLSERVRRVPLDLVARSENPLLGVVRVARRIAVFRRTVLALRPDVVVTFMPQTNIACLIALAGSGVPVVVCERTDPREAPLRGDWSALRRLAYPRARAVIVQTESVASWARGFCPVVHAIPNFVERPPHTASDLDGAGPKRLVALGRLIECKGFDMLIDAFARVAATRPEWSLVIYGEGPERRRLEALARERGVADRVALPGRVSNASEHLSKGHLFALSSRYEGFPNALLEAMACGLPVVSFDCRSGPSEAITHGSDGLLVPAGDVAALAAALARVMDSPEERTRLGRNARKIAETLGPESILPRWTRVLRRACGRE